MTYKKKITSRLVIHFISWSISNKNSLPQYPWGLLFNVQPLRSCCLFICGWRDWGIIMEEAVSFMRWHLHPSTIIFKFTKTSVKMMIPIKYQREHFDGDKTQSAARGMIIVTQHHSRDEKHSCDIKYSLRLSDNHIMLHPHLINACSMWLMSQNKQINGEPLQKGRQWWTAGPTDSPAEVGMGRYEDFMSQLSWLT